MFFSSGEKTLVLKMDITIDAAKIEDFYKGYYEQLMATNLKTYEMSKFLKPMLLKSVKGEKKNNNG